ncbi:hypothetical protein L1049_024190 [Liquidambar formosana]|uniref:RNA polymerase I-specific transcription initiation factor RRN3 n=1 Tax=Liquidambar formosana TaxID=63359 RepID=A0AAP0X4D3_LIQFO
MGVELATDKAGFYEMEDVNFSDSELVQHVRDALRSVPLGNSDSYDQLIGVMHHTEHLAPDEVALLVTSLKALSGAVSCIDNFHHESLLSSAASSGKYVDSCLDMLVSNFMPPHYFLDVLKQPCGLARKDQVLYRVHSALKDITDLVPLAPVRLMPIIIKRMMNMFSEEPLIMIYAENMLSLESGAIGEVVGSTMLMAVVDKLIDLDVEIGWEDILLDDSSKGIFEMELEDVEETADDADKDGGEVFETLLQSFQITVLNVYKSKFAQFVMFYACSLDPENCGVRFAMMLADIFLCSIYPPLTRMSAVAYLASYLSHGKFLSASFVSSMLKRVVDWCLDYCQVKDGDMNPKAHRVFYSGCQAIMYVLCFRLGSMMDVPRLKSELLLMPIEPILKHPLNPLKVCLPSIVEEFLRQAKAVRLFTVSEIFIFNDLLESELSRAFGGMERLDMFFPFDPCLLRKCDRFIRPNFVYWSMVRTTYDEEEGSSDEDVAQDYEDGNGENVAEDGIQKSFEEHDFDVDEFDYSLNKMSITPKNSFSFSFGGELQKYFSLEDTVRFWWWDSLGCFSRDRVQVSLGA